MTASDAPVPENDDLNEAVFQHPETVGPYHIVEVLGEGGMGVVYAAEQVRPVRRRVALKMMKLGMDSKEILGRFQTERQALAVMEHPGIAKVLDAGVSEAGRPYFVMELVRGIRIDEYCDRYRLSTQERIKLFVALCQAVQHAHQKGVIHRDLKPTNILVTEQDGVRVPKIIDFGIAKATGHRLSEATVVTTLGQAMGTLAYMSPEQAEGSELDVDTRSDIFSLGVILFEILVGRVPVDPKEKGVPTFLAQLVSRDTTIPALRDRLPDEGQDVVRTRRYETANGLALDLTRYLKEEPVRARPPTATYRVRKFVRRHRASVGAMLVAVFALIGGTAAATVGLIRARRAESAALVAEAHAQTEAQTARQVSDFLTGIFEVNNPGEALGNTITAREILDRGALQVETELADEPVVQARLMTTIGEVFRRLGLYTDAERLLHASLDVRERVLASDDPEVGEALYYLGLVHSSRGDYQEAQTVLTRARAIFEADTVSDGRRRADILSALGGSYLNQVRLEEAEPLLRLALEEHTRLRGTDDPKVATALSDLGAMYLYGGSLEEAEEYILRSLEIRESRLAVQHPQTAVTYNNLGVLYWSLERYPEALDAYERAREIWENTLGAEHPRVGSVLNNVAEAQWAMGRFAEAEPLFQQALAVKERTLAPDHPAIATTLVGLANVYRDQGRHSAAAPLYRRAIRVLESSLGASHTRLLDPLDDFAKSLRAAGDDTEAERTEARTRTIRERASR
jgi:non-specific serine/threonine protein kinase/serine/threonine-protein kinase